MTCTRLTEHSTGETAFSTCPSVWLHTVTYPERNDVNSCLSITCRDTACAATPVTTAFECPSYEGLSRDPLSSPQPPITWQKLWSMAAFLTQESPFNAPFCHVEHNSKVCAFPEMWCEGRGRPHTTWLTVNLFWEEMSLGMWQALPSRVSMPRICSGGSEGTCEGL